MTASRTTPTLWVLVIITGPSRKPDSSTQVVPVISPLPFCENHPAKTASFMESFPRGRTAVTPVRTGPMPTCSFPSPEMSVVWPTVTPATSVMALNFPGVPSKGTPRSRARAFLGATCCANETNGTSKTLNESRTNESNANGSNTKDRKRIPIFSPRQIKNKSEYEWNQCSLIQKRTVGVKTKPIVCGVRQPGSRFYDVGGVRHSNSGSRLPHSAELCIQACYAGCANFGGTCVRMTGKIGIWFLAAALGAAGARAQSGQPVKLDVDLRDAAKRVYHSKMEFAVSAGPLAL